MSILVVLQWIASGALALFGGFIIVANYRIAVGGGLRRGGGSFIPLFGGVAFALAMLVCPIASIRWYAWLPLVLDPGCVLMLVGFIYSVFVLRCFKR